MSGFLTKQAAMYSAHICLISITHLVAYCCADAVQNVFLSLALLELRQSKI
jgi:hypothetical protein